MIYDDPIPGEDRPDERAKWLRAYGWETEYEWEHRACDLDEDDRCAEHFGDET